MKKFLHFLIGATLLFLTHFQVVYGQACDPKNQVPLINWGNFMTTSTNNGTSGQGVVDTSSVGAGASIWATTGAGQYVDIDLKANYPLTGLIYIPGGQGNQVTNYSAQVSTNGTTWTDVIAYNTPMPQMSYWASGELVREPRVLPFSVGTISARYIRFIVNNGGSSHVAELTPLICNISANLVLNCSNISKLNIGTNSATTGTLGNQQYDSFWTATRKENTIAWGSTGNTTTTNQFNYSSIANTVFVPATTIPNAAPGAWVDSPFGNSKWISYSPNGNDRGSEPSTDTYFYKARFMITDQAFLDDLRLKLDFYADNFVFAIYVNGVKQNNLNNIPGANFSSTGRANTTITNQDFVLGLNEMVVQVVSFGGKNGFLVQNLANCGGRDYGDAPASYDQNSSGTLTPAYHRIALNADPAAVASNRYVSRLGGGDIDGENAPSSSLLADGDDQVNTSTGSIDDENTPNLPTALNTLTPANITIPTMSSNHSGHNSNTWVWIDYNQNGKFEDTERRASVAVATGSVNVVNNVVFTSPNIVGRSKYLYGRIRTSTDPNFIANPTALGYAGDGEVEDFLITINSGSVSGNVYLDPNGGTISGVGTNVTGQLYINLIKNNIVVATQAVAANGSFSFVDIPVGVTIGQLTTQQGTLGQVPPATVLPANFGYGAEGTGTGDGATNGQFSFTITNGANLAFNYAITDTTDSDGDGVPDINDLDDDNDGILDTVECPPLFAIYDNAAVTGEASFNAAVTGIRFENGITANLTRVANPTSGISYATTLRTTGVVNMTDSNIFYPTASSTQNTLVENTRILDNIGRSNYTITLSQPVKSITLHIANWDFLKTQFTGVNQKEELLSGGTELEYDPLTRILRDTDPVTHSSITRDGYGSIKISSIDGQPIQTITFSKMMDILVSNGDGFLYTFSIPNECDADGDGILNYLDLDSDDDGCPDAIEGGDKVLLTQVGTPSGTVSSGNSISGSNVNITGYVNANGVPETVNTGLSNTDGAIGQSIGYSQNASQNACTDSDGDGIPDIDDLDDDNDGILDRIECFQPEASKGDFSSVYTTVSSGNVYTQTLGDLVITTTRNTGSSLVPTTNEKALTTSDIYAVNTPINYVYHSDTGTNTTTFNKTVSGVIGVADVDQLNETATIRVYDESGVLISNLNSYRVTTYTGTSGTYPGSVVSSTITDIGTNLSVTGTSTVTITRTSGNNTASSFHKTNVVLFDLSSIRFSKIEYGNTSTTGESGLFFDKLVSDCKDSDNDGIPDILDLDSDNDGCVDAIEGGDKVKLANLVSAGGTVSVGNGSSATNQNLCANGTCVDANGIPTIVNPGGAADADNAVGQSQGSSTNASVEVCTDSDGDGIPDVEDLDDDNDGILDSVECFQPKASKGDFDAAFTTVTANQEYNQVLGDLTINRKRVSGANLSTYQYTSSNTDNVYALNTKLKYAYSAGIGTEQATFMKNGVQTSVTGIITIADIDATNESATLRVYDAAGNQIPNLASYRMNTFEGTVGTYPNGTPSAMSVGAHVNATGSTDLNIVPNTFIGDQQEFDYNNVLMLDLRSVPFSRVEFSNNQSGGNIILSFDSLYSACKDTDGDGTPDYLDLDSDNDGCVDALEGGDNVLPTQLVTAGGTVIVGNGSPAANQNLCANGTCVDANGIPTIVNPGGAADVGNVIGQSIGDSQNAAIAACSSACYKPAVTSGTALPTIHGITSLGRAAKNNDDATNWPMVRKGAWTALEAKTKGFVPNRLTNAQISAIPSGNLVAGMMVYNTSLDCLQINIDGTATGWKCFNTQTCP